MSMRRCPKCGSQNVRAERRPNGNCICMESNCNHVWPMSSESLLNEFQTYLRDCECEGPGIIMVNNIPVCRWCRKQYAKGSMINYTNAQLRR